MEGAMENYNTAHGGELINLVVDEERANALKALSMDIKCGVRLSLLSLFEF